MKHKIWNWICMVTILVGTSVMASESDVIGAKRLEERGEYSLAAEMLIDNLKEEYSFQNCQLLVDFNQRLLTKLSYQIIRTSPTLFVPPEKDDYWERNKNVLGETLKFDHVTQYAAMRALQNELLDPERVRQVLENFETAKNVVVFLNKTLKVQIKKDPEAIDSTLYLLRIVRA